MPFTPVWDAVSSHFFTPAALSRVVAMTQAATQVESWWKQELIGVLGQLKASGAVTAWDREVRTGQRKEKVDFSVEVPSAGGLVEVKTALCAVQKGTTWRLPMYVMAAKSGYILTDVLKLGALQAGRRYEVVFAYAAPPVGDWQVVLADLRKKAPSLTVSLARLDSSRAGELSIGWLEVA